jgi:glutamine amidotransferase
VHSYCAKPTQQAHVLGVYHYYDEAVTALITKDNVIGCQFHPEKSGQRGLLFLQKFLRI